MFSQLLTTLHVRVHVLSFDQLKVDVLMLLIALKKEAGEHGVKSRKETAVPIYLNIHLAAGRARRNEHVRRVRKGDCVISPSSGILCAVYVQSATTVITRCGQDTDGEGVGAAVGADEDAVVSLVVAAQVGQCDVKLQHFAILYSLMV